MTTKDAAHIAYGLVLILGTIRDEMNKGGIPPTEEEVDSLYDLVTELNEYFESQV